MDRYPEFKYTHTQAYTYESLKQYYPEVFEELKKRVKEGRFEPVGAMYIEPDCNIPSAESLIRQCFYGQQFFRENFGKTINNCWLPDVFGNSWILPQILKNAEWTILSLIKCPLGTILTVFLTIILYGKE